MGEGQSSMSRSCSNPTRRKVGTSKYLAPYGSHVPSVQMELTAEITESERSSTRPSSAPFMYPVPGLIVQQTHRDRSAGVTTGFQKVPFGGFPRSWLRPGVH